MNNFTCSCRCEALCVSQVCTVSTRHPQSPPNQGGIVFAQILLLNPARPCPPEAFQISQKLPKSLPTPHPSTCHRSLSATTHPPPCPRSPSLPYPTFRPGCVLGVRLECVFPKNAVRTHSKRIPSAFSKRMPDAFQKTANLVSRPSAPESPFRKRDPSKKAFQTRPRSWVYSLIPSKIVDLSVPQDTPDATCENMWASPLRNLAMHPCRRH